jgi:predicted membrane protein
MNILSFGANDWTFVASLAIRFAMNITFAYILISCIYAKEHRIREYSFTFFISNILIFLVTSLLASVKVKTGFAFGLFAILSILRYRTEQIQIREMTFLFASIILGVINSLATDELSIFAVLLADILLCLSIFICEKVFIGNAEQIILFYDNTKLLAKERKKELYEDIKNRFGYDVLKVVIVRMNYLTDSAEVKLVYRRG